MAVETVLLALLGLVAVWLVVDAGRERHRLRTRVARDERMAAQRRRRRRSAQSGPTIPTTPSNPDAWPYWPLTLPSPDDASRGPRL